MTILFTAVGNTDPVRDYRDGAILHILRHYPVDRVIVFLTDEMEEHEKEDHYYSMGIHSVKPDLPIEWINSGIKEPHKFDKLVRIQQEFDTYWKKESDAEWILNISSGTPQIKTIMALLAIDYPRCKAVQVDSPLKKSNLGNEPNASSDMLEMIQLNSDQEDDAPNRCSEPPLRLLRRYGLRLQLESLIRNYEYKGALDILMNNQGMFSRTTEKLLRYAVYRENLMWREANHTIADYKGILLFRGNVGAFEKYLSNVNLQSMKTRKEMESCIKDFEFAEYFQVMELKQKKGQLSDFIIKLSPVLVELGIRYLKSLSPVFKLSQCGKYFTDKMGNLCLNLIYSDIKFYDIQLLNYLKCQFNGRFKGGPIYFVNIIHICEYLKNGAMKGNQDHAMLTDIFKQLRGIEEGMRNPIAHTITNLSEKKLTELQVDGRPVGMNSQSILQKLHKAIGVVRGQDISWDYDKLNGYILDSLKE